jgi:hypothetical protein
MARLDPLIALLIGLGWLVVKALQNRKKDAESWDTWNQQPPAPKPHVPSRGEGVPPPKIETPGRNALPPPTRSPMGRTIQRRPDAAPRVPPTIVKTATTGRPQPVIIAQTQAHTAVEIAALKESEELYARTQKLDKAVASRLTAIERETSSPIPAAPKLRTRPPASAHILRTMRNPVTVRQAFLASFVLNPPKALE